MRDQGLPVLIIVSDQSFPALVPASEGLCPIVIRVEDGYVDELTDVLLDRFKAYSKPHGSLPQGSVILIGSLTHIRVRGLADYAEAVVNSGHRLGARMGANVDIVPLPPVPLGGVIGAAAVRSLFDFDTWLTAQRHPVGTCLPEARKVFWEVAAAGSEGAADQADLALVLPGHLKNNRKRPFLSVAVDGGLPTAISPFDSNMEKKVVAQIFEEINEVYGLGLDTNPDLSRDSDPHIGTDTGSVVTIGASHMRRTAEALKRANVPVQDLSSPGWKPDMESVEAIAEAVRALNLTSRDSIIIDAWSNSAYLGTDENGFPVKASRSQVDGRYHIEGDLQIAPLGVFKKILTVAQLHRSRPPNGHG